MPSTNSSPVPPGRMLSIDALRGFSVIWIVGLAELINSFVCLGNNESRPWRFFFWIPEELSKHADWEGFRFCDLIFPLVIFLAGVSISFSIPKWKERSGLGGAYWRIFRRAAVLFALGILYYGGLRGGWEEVRWLGVLQRIALAGAFTGLLFCHLRARGLALVAGAILLGYWWAMAQMPFPNLTLDVNTVHDTMAEYGATNVVEALAKTPDQVRGTYLPGLNLAHYIDALYLPGHRYRSFWDPEGILSTIPAIATCLLGTLAGLFFQRTDVSPARKSKLLALAGLALVVAGWSWGIVFPVVKLIWTSSFVLVAAGYSCWLLALFQWAIEVKGWRSWITPFAWVGANAMTIYMLAKLVGFEKLAARLIGSTEKHWLDAHVLPGFGALTVAAISFGIMLLLARFLYQRKIFLRV